MYQVDLEGAKKIFLEQSEKCLEFWHMDIKLQICGDGFTTVSELCFVMDRCSIQDESFHCPIILRILRYRDRDEALPEDRWMHELVFSLPETMLWAL